jgi:hypothetical protein
MKKIFFLLLFAALFFTFNFKSAFAADFATECGDSGCNPATTTSIFSTEKWFPLRTETRTIQVKNISSIARFIKVSANGDASAAFDLAQKLTVQIKDDASPNNELYGFSPIKHLSEFYLDKEYPLTKLLPSSVVTYSFIITMDDVDNDWQNRSTVFDLQLGFTDEDEPSPTPTQTPTPTPTPENNPGPTNTPGPDPTNTPGPASTPTPTPVGNYIIYNYQGTDIYVPVLGEQTSITPTPTKTDVEGATSKKGKTLGACMNPWWWWLLYIVQIIFQIIMRRIARPRNRRLVLIAQVLSGLLCGFIFWKFFCHWIFWVISTLISLLFLYATHHRSRDVK